VRNCDSWWRWDEVRGTDSGSIKIHEESLTLPRLLSPVLLQPVKLLALLSFEPGGGGTRLGRDTILARARPREETQTGPTVQFDFEFDAQYGTMLRQARHENGCCVQVTEALAASFNAAIDPSLFEFAAPYPMPGALPTASATSSGPAGS
jgi:hypothetical protein